MSSTALEEFEQAIRTQMPAFKVKFKNESWSQKLIGKIVGLFNPLYMTRYITTLGHTVYFPSRESYYSRPLSSLEVLAHEYVHMVDYQRKGLLFSLSYALPQILFVPMLALYVVLGLCGSFFGLLPLLTLALGLACLAPWASPWRTHWELRGYTMSMAVEYWLTGRLLPDTLDSIKKQFTTMAYYRMSWSSAEIERQLDLARHRIWSGDILSAEPYAFVHKFLAARNMVSGPRL